VLIAVTAIIFRQLNYIQQKDASYNRAQVLSLNIPYQFFKKRNIKADERSLVMQSFKNELLTHPAIQQVSLISSNSIVDNEDTNSGGEDWDGRDKDFKPTVSVLNVDQDFQKIVNLKMAAGRWFLPNSKSDVHNVLLNETAVSIFNMHKPVVGKRFFLQGDTGVVIGIVKDFSFRSLHEKIIPLVIGANNYYNTSFVVKIAPGQAKKAVDEAKKVWDKFITTEPFAYTFVNDDFDKLYRNDQKASTLIAFFACIAILISCLGLFGLATFTALYRTKEIGIRKVLGASVVHLAGLISGEFVKLVLIAFVIASPIAYWAMNKWLDDFAYRVSIGWGVFMLAGTLAMLIALLTVSSQAVKAAVVNPVKGLRSE
jgi:ABC-type antimicrobial peptide transport system permease subunit